MTAIKTITVATDFSDNSRVAYKYACALGQLMQATVQLIHIVPHSLGLVLEQEEQVERLKKTSTRLRRFANNPSVKCQVYEGSVADTLIKLSHTEPFDLLVVGLRGERGLFDNLMGSISAALMQKSHCPVLFIPKKTKMPVAISHIVYAFSEESNDSAGIETLAKWATELDATIHFVHVNRPGYNDRMAHIEDNLKAVEAKYVLKELEYITVRGAIDNYCEDKPIDIVAAMTHNHSFWHSLFHNSVTESLAWNSRLPLLVLRKN